MRILYLADDYPNSKVHHNLVQSLTECFDNVEVVVFSSLRESFSIEDSKKKYGDYLYDFIFKDVDINLYAYKFNFWAKKKSKLKGLLASIDIETIDCIIASTLFSDGAVALEINKKYNIPFIVSIRGTDTNLYIKRLLHLWYIGKKIIDKASNLIFISESVKRNFLNSLFVKFTLNDINDKLVVIPNGIDNYFLSNQYPKKDIIKAKNFLYIGDFSSNKNIIFIIKAFEKLQLFYPDINLNLVGGGGRIEGNQEKDIIEYVNNNTSINYLGKIFDRRQLSSVMRENDVFIMVSHGETFGLVYIEALSQGLPIIYTKGQGVDGFFDDMNVGEKADSKSIDSIYNAMKKMIEDYPSYENIGDKINQFTWENNSKMIMNYINNII